MKRSDEGARSVVELYDQTSERWVRSGPVMASDVTCRPATLDLCEPVAGKTIIDWGCGEGYCSRLLQKRGAQVIGIDDSAGMIRAAEEQERSEPLGVRYHQGRITDLSRFADGTVDVVLAVFVFNYFTVEQMTACMREHARVLRPGGKLVFAVPHPSLSYVRKASPLIHFDVGETGYYSGRDRRFDGQVLKLDGTPLAVWYYHKTIEDYLEALRAAGFVQFPTVRELHVTKEALAAQPLLAPLADIPLHLAIASVR